MATRKTPAKTAPIASQMHCKVHIQMTRKLRNEAEEVAQADGRKLGPWIRWLVQQAVRQAQEKKAA